ncbi:hypothetical protein M378DRAFT_292965 [Amanita muscaria Koide BX008]|uniref:Uncharacterized protein n=1 Tax=Amanita muscaria (strain Koide BX008) TaxID=946122 RepID=A0A0C2WBW1_AMAMK|nr:hypothetical protein M378DRAFT_292965 [Amanita muscaria Koide BX008]
MFAKRILDRDQLREGVYSSQSFMCRNQRAPHQSPLLHDMCRNQKGTYPTSRRYCTTLVSICICHDTRGVRQSRRHNRSGHLSNSPAHGPADLILKDKQSVFSCRQGMQRYYHSFEILCKVCAEMTESIIPARGQVYRIDDAVEKCSSTWGVDVMNHVHEADPHHSKACS